jgi:hypothetical protein
MQKKEMTNEKIEYEIGSGNVFKDLEISNPEEYLAKARLALIIYDIINERNLTRLRQLSSSVSVSPKSRHF